MHIPVMREKALSVLPAAPESVIVDATVGEGGHSLEICKYLNYEKGGRLIGIDQDEEILEIARQNLSSFKKLITLVRDNFKDIDEVPAGLGISKLDGVLFDLGTSALQIEKGERGFSFRRDGPLDMRMDKRSPLKAFDLVNNLRKDEIITILRNYGEERWAGRIASNIVRAREKEPISTTGQLAEVVVRAVPPKFRYRYKIHPATRTFQAFRIAVNNELEVLKLGLEKGVNLLKPGGRVCVISFHSLEDRIVKQKFKEYERQGQLKILTKKPVRAGDEEISDNPRSRSAKLRAAEKI